MSKFIGYLEFSIRGVEIELPIECEYDYQPAEPDTHWEPGCDELVTITSARISGNQMLDKLTEDEVVSLERQAGDVEGIGYERKASAQEDYGYEQRRAG